MNASDLRSLATREFMTNGLGGLLTRRAAAVIEADWLNRLPEYPVSVATLFFGNVIERTLGIALGRWIGYLTPTPNLSQAERNFLSNHYEAFDSDEWPSIYRDVMNALVNADDDELTFGDPLISSGLRRDDPALFPVFQAAALIAESLNEGPITSFFLYLREGDVEAFERQMPTPDAVYSILGSPDFPLSFFPASRDEEAVIAGFMRYTEFLTSMEDLFPHVDKTPLMGRLPDVPKWVLDREQIASEIKVLLQWRFPQGDNATNRYKATRKAFFKMVKDQFERYPESGLQWSEHITNAHLILLTYRFFGFAELEDLEVIGSLVSRPVEGRVLNLEELQSDERRDSQKYGQDEDEENEQENYSS